MEKKSIIAMAILGILLALGMSSAAFILGIQARKAASTKQEIKVKGLAEKPVKADLAEWTITISVIEPSFAETLEKIRTVKPKVLEFLEKEGLDKTTWKEASESIRPNMVTTYLESGGHRTEQQGYRGSQDITVTSRDLPRIAAASRNILALQAQEVPVRVEDPQYLVSNLEDVKMSLIAAATENARARAEEFVRQDKVRVGVMRSASQGSFFILPEGGNIDSDNWGGVYDKSTIDKIAKVVVTIVYSID